MKVTLKLTSTPLWPDGKLFHSETAKKRQEECVLGPRSEAATYGRYEVGGGGGHSGAGGGRGVPECFGKESPHHSIAGEKQPSTQQPQRNMELENK